MAFDFPASPVLNQTYAPAGGPTYVWNGVGWRANPSAASPERIVFDETLTAVRDKFDVNLLGLSHFEFKLWALNNAGVASGGVAVRNSVDGGATYRAGASDYVYIIGYSDYPNPMQTGSSTTSLISITNGNMGASAEVPILIEGQFYAGASNRRMIINCHYDGYSSTDRVGVSGGRAAAVGKSTHIRFMADDGLNRFDIGTRLLVKGYS